MTLYNVLNLPENSVQSIAFSVNHVLPQLDRDLRSADVPCNFWFTSWPALYFPDFFSFPFLILWIFRSPKFHYHSAMTDEGDDSPDNSFMLLLSTYSLTPFQAFFFYEWVFRRAQSGRSPSTVGPPVNFGIRKEEVDVTGPDALRSSSRKAGQ